MKKTLALMLVLAMVLSVFAGCGKNEEPSTSTTAPASVETAPAGTESDGDSYVGPDWDAIDAMDYDSASDALYDWNLGEFYEYYTAAKAELDDMDVRVALMALAEAKLMESGVFIPVYGDGGAYAMNRAVPRTTTTTSWGLDEYKWYNQLICNEFITSEDRAALIETWMEAEDADAWYAAAKAFLEENGYTLNDTYNYSTSYDLETWDVLATSYTSDGYFIACTMAGLLEYDAKNVQQPALAESYEVSDDGLTYTFHIRQGVNWVDQQGRVVGEVTANDWVTSMMHLLDNLDALGYLMTTTDGCGIKNFDAYVAGEITDFSEIGVKAVDDYTLVYTLESKFPAFTTMLGYGCFAPLNYAYYKSQGGTFSVEGDEYTAGNYGTSPSTIAYCGPYLVTNYTAQNITSYAANPEFWNTDAVNVQYVNAYYNDGTDATKSYEMAKAGTVAGCSFNSSTLVLARQESPEGETETYFDLYNYTTTNSATTYCGWVNLHRGTWTNYNDTSIGVSPQSEEDIARTRQALSNQNFRLAMAMAFDRGAYNAAQMGEELKYASLKNSYVTGTFASLASDVTVDINGTATSFPAGTYYGEVMQAQLDADNVPIQVWDPNANDGVGSSDGFDGWYSADNAVSYLEAAIAELTQVGVEVSAENPIYIDVPYGAYNEVRTNMYNVYKQSIENVLGGRVIVNLIPFDSSLDWQYAYYRTSTGAESNYDITPGTSGWGPDYGDPQTFLDTVQPYGYMTKCIGLY